MQLKLFSDYTRLWMELINFMSVVQLMEAVEVVLRCHFNVPKMREHQQDKDVHSNNVKEALSSKVLSCWETISKCIPPKL